MREREREGESSFFPPPFPSPFYLFHRVHNKYVVPSLPLFFTDFITLRISVILSISSLSDMVRGRKCTNTSQPHRSCPPSHMKIKHPPPLFLIFIFISHIFLILLLKDFLRLDNRGVVVVFFLRQLNKNLHEIVFPLFLWFLVPHSYTINSFLLRVDSNFFFFFFALVLCG